MRMPYSNKQESNHRTVRDKLTPQDCNQNLFCDDESDALLRPTNKPQIVTANRGLIILINDRKHKED